MAHYIDPCRNVSKQGSAICSKNAADSKSIMHHAQSRMHTHWFFNTVFVHGYGPEVWCFRQILLQANSIDWKVSNCCGFETIGDLCSQYDADHMDASARTTLFVGVSMRWQIFTCNMMVGGFKTHHIQFISFDILQSEVWSLMWLIRHPCLRAQVYRIGTWSSQTWCTLTAVKRHQLTEVHKHVKHIL